MNAQERLAVAFQRHHDVKDLRRPVDLTHLGDWIGREQLTVVGPRTASGFPSLSGNVLNRMRDWRIPDVHVVHGRRIHVGRVERRAQSIAVLDGRFHQFPQLILIVGVDRLIFQPRLQRILQRNSAPGSRSCGWNRTIAESPHPPGGSRTPATTSPQSEIPAP